MILKGRRVISRTVVPPQFCGELTLKLLWIGNRLKYPRSRPPENGPESPIAVCSYPNSAAMNSQLARSLFVSSWNATRSASSRVRTSATALYWAASMEPTPPRTLKVATRTGRAVAERARQTTSAARTPEQVVL